MPPQHAFRYHLPVLHARGAWRHLRRADEMGIGVVWETPDPATRHPVTERSEVEVPRSDIVPADQEPAGVALDGRAFRAGPCDAPQGKIYYRELI